MENLINSLMNVDNKFILPKYEEIISHLKKGYITQEDYLFLEYCHPLIELSYGMIKNLNKENKNEY